MRNHIDVRAAPINDPPTVHCWNCSAELTVDLLPLWGVCWKCRTATGEDGLRYILDEVPGSLELGRLQWKARLLRAGALA